MNKRSLITSAVCSAAALAFMLAPACGGGSGSQFNPNGGSGSGGGDDSGAPNLIGGGSGGSSSGGGLGADGGCLGLQCQIHACSGKPDGTTISGHIYDPAGTNVLYKVAAYVPNNDPSPITDGITPDSCSCDSLYTGNPIASGISQPDGSFTIKNAPDGKDIPIVIQIGKWRNYFTIPTVTNCGDNNVDTLLPAKLTLPKTQTETKFSNIPNIAISTGGADTMECILERIGVSSTEYGGDPTDATKHIHIFQGRKGATTSPQATKSSATGGLWDTGPDMNRYDVVMLSCEGSETTGANGNMVGNAESQVLADYVNGGGRVFASHYHYAFFFNDQTNTNATQFPNVADWSLANAAANGGSDNYSTAIGATIQTKLSSGANFPEGQALATWLGNVGALGNVDGLGLPNIPATDLGIPDQNGRYDGLVGPTNVSTVWATADTTTLKGGDPVSSQYFSFDMPFNAPLNDAGTPNYCGRVVFSDLHVGALSNDYPKGKPTTVPAGCSYPQKLAPDEDAIEFILFDLSSCVTPVTGIPQPPPTPQPPVK